MNDDTHPTPEAAFQRGVLLQQQERMADAAACFQQALALNPEHTPSLLNLAFCWMRQPETAAQAVEAARRAVALEPEHGQGFAVLALALNARAKDGQTAVIKEARAMAEKGVELEPDSPFTHTVLALLRLRLRDYSSAEQAARAALALDPEDTMAAEALSSALLMQRKDADNRSLIDYHLQRQPEDDSAHTSAGWQALMTGDHRKANQHFMEALRLNPMNERARSGLVESYRARSWFYNAFLRYAHWMNQFTEGRQTMILIGGFVAYRLLHGYLKTTSPALASALVVAWVLLVFWSHLARGLSGFLLLLDRFARQSLDRREFWEGAMVGGLCLLSVAAFVSGAILSLPGADFKPLYPLFAAITCAAALSNDHHLGRYFYAIAAAVATAGALYGSVYLFSGIKLPLAALGGLAAIVIGVVTTWLRTFRFLYA